MCRFFAFFALTAPTIIALCAHAQEHHVNSVAGSTRSVVSLSEPFGLLPVVYEFEGDGDVEDAPAADADAPTDAAEPTCDCICCRSNLFPDRHGIRTSLAQHGIIWAGQLTQFHQGVTQGGARRDFDYSGKLDQFVMIDFEKLGLCHHLKAAIHVETGFGETVILDAAGMAPVNTNMLYPKLNDGETAITNLSFELALTDEWSATFGKFNTLDLLQMIFPQTGRGVDGFMNTSMILPLSQGRTMPLAFLGAGVMKKRGHQVQGAALVYDSNDIRTTAGFDDLFDNGANVLGLWRIFTDCGGRPGSHTILGTWASGEYTSLDPLGWAIIPGQGIVAPEVTGSWSVAYFYEKQLWADPCNQKQKIALFSEWGYADPETSPYEWTANVSLQGHGLHCCRQNDTMGAGYFYSGLSQDFKNLLQGFVPVDDLQGVELYYNAEITPWFHLTADLQIVEPAVRANDTAVVFGLRGKINL